MEHRTLGRTGANVSVVGLGTWQLGSDWGDVNEGEALDLLGEAQANGVDFLDTADVYGDGRSEALIGRYLATADVRPFVATKMGRRVDQVPENYTEENFRAWNDRSRANLGVDTLDLVQLHCPPTPVFGDERVYDALDRLVEDGRIAHYGVSVETCAEALTAMERPNVASVQIILNVFRRKPLDEVLPTALEKGVGIIARVPSPPGCSPAGTRPRPPSLPPTTAPTTATARPSTWERPSRASATTTACVPPRSSPPSHASWVRRVRPRPRWRCGGSSTGRASRP